MLESKDGSLYFRYGFETLRIEPWGPNAFRVRATRLPTLSPENWALLQPNPSSGTPKITLPPVQDTLSVEDCPQTPISIPKPATIINGNITAEVTARGKLTITNTTTGKTILEEYCRNRQDILDPKLSSLSIKARDFKPGPNGSNNFHLTYRLESLSPSEKIYGMGQYQQPCLDLKGLDLELAQRNSQASVPFLISSLGYGLLWNNPAVGRAVFGKNLTSFEAYSTPVLDYWIVTGDTPAEILKAYGRVVGTVPMMPEYGLGFWQCKLRYQTQDEVLSVAREYKRRNLPIDVIVIDFFHWPVQGSWMFDEQFWPDPEAMIAELKSLKIAVMVSIWPTVDKTSPLYPEMLEQGLLIHQDRGIPLAMTFQGDCVHADFTNPSARTFVWEKCKKNYFDKGIELFWLDEAEPEYVTYDFDLYRYHKGSVLSVGNHYPVDYARAFYDGQMKAGQKDIVNLVRCAWAGSQRYGALIWSGDIASSWSSFRNQLAAGLNMGMAGIPWWTTDIGGFHGGNPNDPGFRELLIRWFQWGCFCPVFRLHGDREPRQPQLGHGGGSTCRSGADNEVWSYGEENYPILVNYMKLRERLRGYVRGLMKEAHEKGIPVMRAMFFEFPNDPQAWSSEIEDQYMFGNKYLCAPIMEAGMKKRKVYLPKGTKWRALEIGEDKDKEGKEFEGGQTLEVDLVIENMPVFVRQ